jgi:hypothetical protein
MNGGAGQFCVPWRESGYQCRLMGETMKWIALMKSGNKCYCLEGGGGGGGWGSSSVSGGSFLCALSLGAIPACVAILATFQVPILSGTESIMDQ